MCSSKLVLEIAKLQLQQTIDQAIDIRFMKKIFHYNMQLIIFSDSAHVLEFIYIPREERHFGALNRIIAITITRSDANLRVRSVGASLQRIVKILASQQNICFSARLVCIGARGLLQGPCVFLSALSVPFVGDLSSPFLSPRLSRLACQTLLSCPKTFAPKHHVTNAHEKSACFYAFPRRGSIQGVKKKRVTYFGSR